MNSSLRFLARITHFLAIFSCIAILLNAPLPAAPLDNWQLVTPLPQVNTLYGVNYGNGRFVAVGVSGTVMTSTDGQHWTVQASGTTADLYDVAYGNHQFMAVGAGSTVLTSPDGVTWMNRTSNILPLTFGQTFHGAAFGAGIFSLVGGHSSTSGSTNMWSPDGVTWHSALLQVQDPQNSQVVLPWYFNRIAYGNGRFVASGDYGVVATGTFAQVGSSGGTPSYSIVWTYPFQAGSIALGGVAFGKGVFATIGSTTSGSPGVAAESFNGVTWTSQATPGYNFSVGITGMTYGNNNFVATAYDQSISVNQLISSLDGITWIGRATGSSSFAGVGFGNNTFVSVGRFGALGYSTVPASQVAINTQPAGQTVVVGGNASFTVAATGTAPLIYQWRKNGANLTSSGTVSGVNISTLSISNVATTDFGIYSVLVSDANGVVTSIDAPLAVVASAGGIPVNPIGTASGKLAISAGTGAFSALTSGNKTVTIPAGTILSGTISLQAINTATAGQNAPLIVTPSWGDDATSWRTVSASIPTGASSQVATVAVKVPDSPGTYHLNLAFLYEPYGAPIASATSTNLSPAYNDGNDLAQIGPAQIAMSQLSGYTIIPFQFPTTTVATGSAPVYFPSDVVNVVVTGATGAVGSMQVTLGSSAPVAAGAQWNIDGGAWHNSGDAVTGVAAGSRTVNFKSVSGYTSPISQAVEVTANELSTTSAVYTYPVILVQQPLGRTLINGSSVIDFGSTIPALSLSQTFTVQNSGTAILAPITPTIDGSNAGDFIVTAQPITPVPPGASTTFVVRFTPDAITSRSAVLHLASNDPLTPVFNINLTGTGISATHVKAVYTTGAEVPITASSFTATGSTLSFTLNHAPVPGAILMVVKVTGQEFIGGSFNNLAQGQLVNLDYGGTRYHFVANYYGGTGNDLVLQWAANRLVDWGYGTDGELGDGTTADSLLPVSVSMSGVLNNKIVMAIAEGGHHALALCADGTLAAWGYGRDGELGNGLNANSSVPVLVNRSGALLNKTVALIAAGSYHGLTLCTDGTLAAWGDLNGSSVPALVNQTGALAGKRIVALSGGWTKDLFLTADGSVFTWSGGSPTQIDQTGVLASKTVIAVSAGYSHYLVLCSDGTLASWGTNTNGELGNGGINDHATPVLVIQTGVLAGKKVVSIAAGLSYSVVECDDGTMATWGANNVGQLGNNSTTGSNAPVLVDTSGVLAQRKVVSFTAAEYNVLATCSDGTIATWGGNGYGQLGIGTTAGSTVPVLVSTAGLAANERMIAAQACSSSVTSLAFVANNIFPGILSTPPPTLTWINGGNANWTIQTAINHDGVDAARSGTITHTQETWLETTVVGPGSLTFWWKVSSESNYDFLEFYLDGALQTGRISGSVNWAQKSYSVLAGSHTFRWRYAKDASTSSGTDAGWLDEVTWSPVGGYPLWAAGQFPPTQLTNALFSGATADADKDGVVNLLEYAFNLPATTVSNTPLTPTSGIAGLPAVSQTGSGSTLRLRLEYIRKTSGLDYEPQFSASLSNTGGWTAATGTTSVTPINADWERVITEDTAGSGQAKRFGRVKVTAP